MSFTGHQRESGGRMLGTAAQASDHWKLENQYQPQGNVKQQTLSLPQRAGIVTSYGYL